MRKVAITLLLSVLCAVSASAQIEYPSPEYMESYSLLCHIGNAPEPLAMRQQLTDLHSCMGNLDKKHREEVEWRLFVMARRHESEACRLRLMRYLIANAESEKVYAQLFAIWKETDSDLLTERDFMHLACRLAKHYPTLAHDILTEERDRLIDEDLIEEMLEHAIVEHINTVRTRTRDNMKNTEK